MASAAVLIGVPNPDSTLITGRQFYWDGLEGVANDLAAVRAVLLGAATPLSPMSILTLIHPGDTTAANIKKVLDERCGQLQAGDTFVMMLNGHGYHVVDKSGDELDRWDEVFIASDGKVILDDEFAERWSKVPEDATIIGLVDTCHADTSGLLAFPPMQSAPRTNLKLIGREDSAPSKLFFSASLEGQNAYERDVRGRMRGVLSGALTDTWSFSEGPRQSYATLFSAAQQRATELDNRQTTRVRFIGPDSDNTLSRRPFSIS